MEDVYGATIERIKAQGGYKCRLGMEALMWICYAEVPLSPDELCHALAIELGSTDFNAANIPSIATVVSCCQGLITVDKEASKVRLIHFTLREYLSAPPDIFIRPHSDIAEICLIYLNSSQVKGISVELSGDIQGAPFLRYSSVYWGVHAKRELSDYARSLALELLQDNDDHISWKLVLGKAEHLITEHFNKGSPFSGLHGASFFGIAEVVAVFIEMECYDLNGRDCWGSTPLSIAADQGHEEVVKILVGREEVNPNKGDNFGYTPLSYATGGGHEGIVKILLEREEVNPNKPDNEGKTPLSYAAKHGREGVVKILLGREEVKPDKSDYYGRTPLSYAAKRGHEGVVDILLKRKEVKLDKSDYYGRTPLSHAARKGHEGVVRILLERDEVNPDMPDDKGRTPLALAAKNGHEGVVRALLAREEVDHDKPDNSGQTPRMLAARCSHPGVIALLQPPEATIHGPV